MSNPVRLTLTLAAANVTAVAASQTPGGAGNLVLTGGANLVAGPTLIQGIVLSGVAVGTPVATTLDFLIVTQVTVSGATAGAITVGTNTTGSTSWVKTSTDMNNWALSAAGVVVSGSANYQIEHTYDDPNGGPGNTSYFSLSDSSDVMPNAAQPPFVFLTGTAQTNTNYEVQYANQPITAQRLTITSGTGLVAFYSVQSGLRS